MLKKIPPPVSLLIVLVSTFILLYPNSHPQTMTQIMDTKNQEDKFEHVIVEGYLISIALNEVQESFAGGHRKIFLLTEESYFTNQHLINIFNSLSDKFKRPKCLFIYAYSDRNDLQLALNNRHNINILVKPRTKERDSKTHQSSQGLFAEYYRSGIYIHGKKDEIIEYKSNNGNNEKITINLKPKTNPEGEANANLLMATMDGQNVELQEALNHGANVNTQDKYGDSALMLASLRGDIEIVRKLIEHGANINLTNDEGESALMFATITEKIEIVKLLISLGADTQIKNNEGLTALDIAKSHNSKDIIKLLKKSE